MQRRYKQCIGKCSTRWSWGEKIYKGWPITVMWEMVYGLRGELSVLLTPLETQVRLIKGLLASFRLHRRQMYPSSTIVRILKRRPPGRFPSTDTISASSKASLALIVFRMSTACSFYWKNSHESKLKRGFFVNHLLFVVLEFIDQFHELIHDYCWHFVVMIYHFPTSVRNTYHQQETTSDLQCIPSACILTEWVGFIPLVADVEVLDLRPIAGHG
jgi:hypothetical protein